MSPSMKAKKDAYDVAPIPDADLTEKELAACIAVIKKGQAVDWRSALRELPLATAVVIARKGREIVGVGAIKRERQEYAQRFRGIQTLHFLWTRSNWDTWL